MKFIPSLFDTLVYYAVDGRLIRVILEGITQAPKKNVNKGFRLAKMVCT